MSRIGKKPIAIPKGVTVKVDGSAVEDSRDARGDGGAGLIVRAAVEDVRFARGIGVAHHHDGGDSVPQLRALFAEGGKTAPR